MTASVTMRMWRSMSCAFWRPDPRHGAEPREPLRRLDIARRDGLPRRFRSSTLRACGAGRLALEQIPQRGLQRPWANPRTCARGCRRGSRSYPQFRCTNLTPSCAQTLAVNTPRPPRLAPPCSCTPFTADGPARTSRRLSGQATGPDSPGSTGRSTAAATPTKPSTPTSTAASPATQKPPLHKPHTSAPYPRGGGADSAAASRRRHLRRWLAALHQAVADGRWGRRSFGVELVGWAVADAARHSQSIYADFGVRHLSMGTGTVLDP